MHGESILADEKGNVRAEKNFSVEKESEGVYRISNYIIRGYDEFYDVLLTGRDVEYIEEDVEDEDDYTITSEKVKLGELFEDGFRVEMRSTLIRSDYDDLEILQQGDTVLDSDKEVLNRDVYEEARKEFRVPVRNTENFSFRKGDKFQGEEWSLRGKNWPAVLEIIEEEDIESFEELSDVEVRYRRIKS